LLRLENLTNGSLTMETHLLAYGLEQLFINSW
jgi:hypothetical protein